LPRRFRIYAANGGFTLKGAGHRVFEAVDGLDVLKVAKNQSRFDLVISDVIMPNMDGIVLIRKLRAIPDFKFMSILMLTTESGTDKKAEGKAAGATGLYRACGKSP
jgi:two-component system, chemotaxis family, chemotaxis protein CheY